MQHHVVTAVVVACLAGTISSQVPISGSKARVVREVEEKKKLMREGKLIRTSVRVTVRLRNGSRLRGVVRDGRFIERVDKELSFVPSDFAAPGAGLRLWYYNDTNSYIFLSYGSILTHQIGDRLTNDEVKAIAKQFEEAEKARRMRADAARAAREAAKLAKQNGADGDEPADEPDAASLTAKQKALLAEFPPDDGWSKDRMEEIETRKITLGVYPDKKGQRFLEVFPEWNEANEISKSSQEKPGDDPKPESTPPAPGKKPAPPGKYR